MLKAEWWGWAKVWLYEVVMAVKGGSTRSSFGRRGISQVVQGHVQVASWAAAWAHAELSTPPKTYLAFLVLAVPSSWYIWLSILGSRALYHPRAEGGQTKEVAAKKRLGGAWFTSTRETIYSMSLLIGSLVRSRPAVVRLSMVEVTCVRHVGQYKDNK